MSNLDSYKSLKKYTDFLKSLSFKTVIVVAVSLFLLKTWIEPSFEKDYHGNPILAEHGILDLKEHVDISPFYAINVLDHNYNTMDRFKGKILVLMLWSLDCAVCVIEMQQIAKLTDLIKTESSDTLQFVAIATPNTSSEKITALFKLKGFKRFHALYTKKFNLFEALSVDQDELPRYFIVNRQGYAFAEIKNPFWEKKSILEPLYAYSLIEHNTTTNYDISIISKAQKEYRKNSAP